MEDSHFDEHFSKGLKAPPIDTISYTIYIYIDLKYYNISGDFDCLNDLQSFLVPFLSYTQ